MANKKNTKNHIDEKELIEHVKELEELYKNTVMSDNPDYVTLKKDEIKKINNSYFSKPIKKKIFNNDDIYAKYWILKFLTNSNFKKDDSWKKQFKNILDTHLKGLTLTDSYSLFYLFQNNIFYEVKNKTDKNALTKSLLEFIKEKKWFNGYFSDNLDPFFKKIYGKLNEENKQIFLEEFKKFFLDKASYNDSLKNINLLELIELDENKVLFFEALKSLQDFFQKYNNEKNQSWFIDLAKKFIIKLEEMSKKKEITEELSKNNLVDNLIKEINNNLLIPKEKSEIKDKLILSYNSDKEQFDENLSNFWELINIFLNQPIKNFLDLNFDPNLKFMENAKNVILEKNLKEINENFIETVKRLTEKALEGFILEDLLGKLRVLSDTNIFSKSFIRTINDNFNYSFCLLLVIEIEWLLRYIIFFIKNKLNKSNSVISIKNDVSRIRINNIIKEILDFLNTQANFKNIQSDREFFNSLNFYFYDIKGLNLRNELIHKINEFIKESEFITDFKVWGKFFILVILRIVNFYKKMEESMK